MTRAKSTREEKKKWLEQHPELWGSSSELIKKRMVEAGLVAKSTYWKDIGIPTMLKECREVGLIGDIQSKTGISYR